MKNDVTRQLKRFREIQPESQFQAHSKELILGTRQKVSLSYLFRNPLTVGSVAAVGAFALLLATVLITQTGNAPTLSSLDKAGELDQELNELTISIQLKEISYQDSANQTIAAAIDEIIDGKARHLNQNILREEQELLGSFDENENEYVEGLLNHVIF